MALNLDKIVVVSFEENAIAGTKGYVFEIRQNDLPREIIGKDCCDIANMANSSGIAYAVPYRKRENGEMVPPNVHARELYDILRTVPPTIGKDGKPELKGAEFPPIIGVVLKDPALATTVSQLFENKGYRIQKNYR